MIQAVGNTYDKETKYTDFWTFYHLQLVTKAPADCMCRPCTAVDESSIMPSEISGYSDPSSMIASYGSMSFK